MNMTKTLVLLEARTAGYIDEEVNDMSRSRVEVYRTRPVLA